LNNLTTFSLNIEGKMLEIGTIRKSNTKYMEKSMFLSIFL